MNLLRLLVSLLVLGACLSVVKACHRLDPPPGLEQAQMQAALVLARATALGRSLPTDPALASLTVTEPVFVSIYGPSREARRDPAIGSWVPTSGEGELPLAQALERAARAATERASERGRGRGLDRATFKIDLAGPTRSTWLGADLYLELMTDPGRDGLAIIGDEPCYRLPSWPVEHASEVAAMARDLTDACDDGGLARFRTRAFAEGSDRQALPLFRGNVLLHPPDAARVRHALLEAGRYLARMVRDDGSYCYRYEPLTDTCAQDYNLLRHAGTTYSLFQIYRVLPEPGFLEAAERATGWLRRQIRPVPAAAARSYLLEGDTAKLGAAGLTLIALVERELAVGDGQDRATLTRLADFVISQQRDDGYLASFFDWGPGARMPRQESIYYPGEALLGLVRLYGIDPQPRFLEAAKLTADYLANQRWRFAGVEVFVPPDAWLGQALSELDAVAPADFMRDYAYEIISQMEMSMLPTRSGAPPDVPGGPTAGYRVPRTTPAGARNEAITAVWRQALRRGDGEEAAHFRVLALRSARFQLQQQYRPENSFFLANPRRAQGGFRGSLLEADVQIDYVQHNVSGLLVVLEMLEGRGG